MLIPPSQLKLYYNNNYSYNKCHCREENLYRMDKLNLFVKENK